MFQPGTSVATNDVAHYLPEICLPNQKYITDRRIPILQVVNKIISIRLTPTESFKSICESKKCWLILCDQWGKSIVLYC